MKTNELKKIIAKRDLVYDMENNYLVLGTFEKEIQSPNTNGKGVYLPDGTLMKSIQMAIEDHDSNTKNTSLKNVIQLMILICVNFDDKIEELYDALEYILRKINPKCDLEIKIFNKNDNGYNSFFEYQINLHSMVDIFVDFISTNFYHSKFLNDFYDVYYSRSDNDILIDLEDLKFLNDDYVVEDIDMVLENNITDNDLANAMKKIIDNDILDYLKSSSIIFVLFNVNENINIMKIYDAMELLDNHIDDFDDDKEIVFSIKFYNQMKVNCSKIFLLSVSENVEKLVISNNTNYMF